MSRRNPNMYGSVTKLSGNRSRPYMVRITMYDDRAIAHQVPIGYTATREEANILLAKYNDNPWRIDRNKITLLDLYHQWEKVELPRLSKSQQGSFRAAFKNCTKYYGYKYRSIRSYQMQDTIDSCPNGPASKGQIKTLWHHLDRYAMEMDIIDKMYSDLISAPSAPETTREPFSEEQIDRLWSMLDTVPWTDTVLIYIYTGFRISELLSMPLSKVDLVEWTLQGGEKTKAGRDRIVPIHPRIRPLVEARANNARAYIFERKGKRIEAGHYRYELWAPVMAALGTDKTPHEARHTFETRLDNAGANRKCIDMLMGHSSQDVGNRVYNHKTLEQLRDTINLLR